LYQEALYQVYVDRILRGTGSDGVYSISKLGAFGADLGAVAAFFERPWERPSPNLSAPAQAWLLNQAASCLRALGRLEEALEPMAAGAELYVQQQEWKAAAIIFSNLSELQLTLGRVAAARATAEQALSYADRSGEWSWRMVTRTTLADAQQQQGESQAAAAGFREAEALQVQRQPQYPLLYSVPGFRYCDLLLAPAEREAWTAGGWGGAAEADQDGTARTPEAQGRPAPGSGGESSDLAGLLAGCAQVRGRAAQTLKWEEGWPGAPLLDFALHHLSLARCALYAALLQGQAPSAAREDAEGAVAGLRAAGAQHYIPHGLLTRASLRRALGDAAGSRADLDEAESIATRGAMRLHLADIHLYRARLFPTDPDRPARAELARARALIESCGYGRRLAELEDAEQALG
jgi:ATP/maltotriose-dependent transcriptional regulator MalT